VCITGINKQLVVSGEKRLSTDRRYHGGIRANLRPPNDLARERTGPSCSLLYTTGYLDVLHFLAVQIEVSWIVW
jgi:hypothetical protein